MKFYDIDQNSEEWNEIRIAKFTASMFGDLFSDKKTATYQITSYFRLMKLKMEAFMNLTNSLVLRLIER